MDKETKQALKEWVIAGSIASGFGLWIFVLVSMV